MANPGWMVTLPLDAQFCYRLRCILPLTTAMVLMGAHIVILTVEIWLMIGVGGLVLWFVLRRKVHLLDRKT